MSTALIITHVAFEDAGSLLPELQRAGYEVRVFEAACADWRALAALQPELAVVLGGPIGVYETAAYPFLTAELAWLANRLAARRPTLGICLGAQLMAAALGARVYPGERGKELGWAPLLPGGDIAAYPHFAQLIAAAPMLHWHGDTFDLPAGVRHLAATERYASQAFALDDYALGLQFHPEVGAAGLERWYVGHAVELAQQHIDVAQLRAASALHAPRLEPAARVFWRSWLAALPAAAGAIREGA